MYHDQALIPFKYISKYRGVNYTGNLDVIRVSPDHGTAYDLVGTKNYLDSSIKNCFKTIVKINNIRGINAKSKKVSSQNFLIDKNICKKIIKEADIKNKNILEIGPGKGILTEFILNENQKLILIEKDDKLFKFLKKYNSYNNIKIINCDILDYEINNLKNINIISNLPYNKTSTKIILKLFKSHNIIDKMVVMLQKKWLKNLNIKNLILINIIF